MFALSIVVLLAFAALAVDVARFYTERRFLQNAADAAALAAGNALVQGKSNSEAEQLARDVLAVNFQNDPNGTTPPDPSVVPLYEDGHAGEPGYLIEGILIGGGDVRVAIRNPVEFTLGRAVGLTQAQIGAHARVSWNGNLLPIAVRRYLNAPGPSAGAAYPCSANPADFVDTLSTGDTSCLGTEADASLRTEPSSGAAFDVANPNNDPGHHGPILELLGQGAQPSNGADFRGFIALDIRNFQNFTSNVFHNGIGTGTNENTLKAFEADWISAGGYPGPAFPPATTPPDPSDQVAIMSGNSAGISIDALADRFVPGDEILVAVYSGTVMSIPDFVIAPPGTVSIGTSETVATAGAFKVSRNQSFSGQVDLETLPDSGNPNDPITTSTLTSSPPITYDPSPVTPTLGSGATVTLRTVTTSGATAGIYTLWVHGEAGSPYYTDHTEPFVLNIGGVQSDFTITSDAYAQTAVNVGDTVAWTIAVSTPNKTSTYFNGNVTLSLDTPWPSGMGTPSWSSTTTGTLAKGASVNRTLTINSGTLAPGQYDLVVRATGTNGAGQPVTHLLPISLAVATAGTSDDYVDIIGFAVFRISAVDANTVWGYAISSMKADMNDPALRRGQVARLVPWS